MNPTLLTVILSALLVATTASLIYTVNRIFTLKGHVSLLSEARGELEKVFHLQQQHVVSVQADIAQTMGDLHTKLDELHAKINSTSDHLVAKLKFAANTVETTTPGDKRDDAA